MLHVSSSAGLVFPILARPVSGKASIVVSQLVCLTAPREASSFCAVRVVRNRLCLWALLPPRRLGRRCKGLLQVAHHLLLDGDCGMKPTPLRGKLLYASSSSGEPSYFYRVWPGP